jgi:hypothetical protein
MLLLVATVPTGIVGIVLKPYVEATKGDPRFVGAMEIVSGLYLAVSYFRKEGAKDGTTMTYVDAAVIGVVQGFAVLPGLSRSASTIAFGLLLGFAARWAADFTFLLAIPAIVGAAGLEIVSALRHEGAGFFATPDFARYLFGAAIAGVAGYMTIGFLIRMVSTRKVHLFAIYCFLFGLALIFLFPARGPGSLSRAAPGDPAARMERAQMDRGVDEDAAREGDRQPDVESEGLVPELRRKAQVQHREVDSVARENRDQVLDPPARRHAAESIAIRR